MTEPRKTAAHSGPDLAALARAVRAGAALDADWFADLGKGVGPSAVMGQSLRDALTVATAAEASEAVARSRARAEQRRQLEHEENERRRKREATEAEQARVAAKAERKQQAQQLVAKRKSFDRTLLVVAVVASVTVLLPWLIGRFLLRDAAFHPRSGLVYDVVARSTGDYFVADWWGGIAVWLLVTASAIAVGSWRQRASSILAAAVAVAVAVFAIIPASTARWEAAEADTARALATTAYPFSGHWATCGSAVFYLSDDTGTHLYQIHTARTVGASACDRLVVYDGWREIGRVTLPSGETLGVSSDFFGVSGLSRVEGTTGADTGVATSTSAGDLIGLMLASPDQIWRAVGEAAEEYEYQGSSLIVASHGLNQPGSVVHVLDPVTGALMWAASCPGADEVLSSAAHESDAGNVVLPCQGPGGPGDTGARDYGFGRDGTFIGACPRFDSTC